MSFFEVAKEGGDGAAEVSESEQPAKMSTGKARSSNDARFDGRRGTDWTILFIARRAKIGIACPLLYCNGTMNHRTRVV